MLLFLLHVARRLQISKSVFPHSTLSESPFLHHHRNIAVCSAHALAEINRLRDQEGHDIRAAVASKTDEPQWARVCMDYLVAADGLSLSHCFGDLVEIAYSNKKEHLRRLHKTTGIPYEQMVFFDNEHYNITSVQQLGVKCIYTPDGMTTEHWEEAKQKFGMSSL